MKEWASNMQYSLVLFRSILGKDYALAIWTVCIFAIVGCHKSEQPKPDAQSRHTQPEWTLLNGKALREYFDSNAPTAWERYRRQLTKVRVEYSVGEPVIGTGEYFANEESQMFRLANDRIVGRNPRYQFTIVKNDSGEWELESFHRSDDTNSRELQYGFVFDYAPQIVERLLTVHNTSLPELVSSKSFEIQNIRVVKTRGTPFIRIEFTVNDNRNNSLDWEIRGDPIVDGHVVLDPENYWIIKEAAVYDASGTGVIDNYVAEITGDIPVPRRFSSIWDYDSEGGGWKEGPSSFKYQFHIESISLADFLLPTYGIEEPGED